MACRPLAEISRALLGIQARYAGTRATPLVRTARLYGSRSCSAAHAKSFCMSVKSGALLISTQEFLDHQSVRLGTDLCYLSSERKTITIVG